MRNKHKAAIAIVFTVAILAASAYLLTADGRQANRIAMLALKRKSSPGYTFKLLGIDSYKRNKDEWTIIGRMEGFIPSEVVVTVGTMEGVHQLVQMQAFDAAFAGKNRFKLFIQRSPSGRPQLEWQEWEFYK